MTEEWIARTQSKARRASCQSTGFGRAARRPDIICRTGRAPRAAAEHAVKRQRVWPRAMQPKTRTPMLANGRRSTLKTPRPS